MKQHIQVSHSFLSPVSVREFCVASCRKLAQQIQQMKTRILGEFRKSFGSNERLLQLALNEAEALAWQTGYPQLVFPELAHEKAQAVTSWKARQAAFIEHEPHLVLAH
jgi:hypothetical protein